MRGIFLFISGVLIFSVQAAEKDSPQIPAVWTQAEWHSWIDRYASSSPFVVTQKTSSEKIRPTEEHYQAVLKGKSKLKLDPPVEHEGHKYKEFNLLELSGARRFEVVDQFAAQLSGGRSESKEELLHYEHRHRQMTDRMVEMLNEREDDELLLFFVGATHALDLFFAVFLKPDMLSTDPLVKVRDEVLYAAPEARLSTPFYTKEYYRFQRAMTGVETEEKTLEAYQMTIRFSDLARLFYFNGLQAGSFNYDDIFKDRKVSPGALVMMDTHYLRSPEVYKRLPPAAALIETGFKKVTFVMESFKQNKEYKDSDIERLYMAQQMGMIADEDKSYFKNFRPQAYRLYKKNFVVNAGLHALHEKLKDYQLGGIKVKYTGLEPYDRFGSTKDKETAEKKKSDQTQ